MRASPCFLPPAHNILNGGFKRTTCNCLQLRCLDNLTKGLEEGRRRKAQLVFGATSRCVPCYQTTMNLEGLEVIAVMVVLVLFVKVLEQFGLFEPVAVEGNV